MNVYELWVYSFAIKVIGFASNVILINAVSLEAFGLQTVTMSFISNSLSWIRAEFGRPLLQKNVNAPEIFTMLSLLVIYLTCGLSFVVWSAGSVWVPRVAESFRKAYVFSLMLYGATAVVDSLAEWDHVIVCTEPGGVEFTARLESQSQAAASFLVLSTVILSHILCPTLVDRNFILAGAVSRFLSSIWHRYQIGRYHMGGKRQVTLHRPNVWEQKWIFEGRRLIEARRSILRECRNSLQKFVTIEGDKVVMMRLGASTVGAIGSAQNLGSMVVRVFFAPTEAGIRAHYCLFDSYETVNLNPFKEATKLQISLGSLSTLFGFYFAQPTLRIIRGSAFKPLESEALAYYSLLLLPLSISGLTDGVLHVVDKTGADYGRLQSIVFITWLFGACTLWLIGGSYSDEFQVTHWFMFTGLVQVVRLLVSIHILSLRFGLGLQNGKGTLIKLFHPISREVAVLSFVWGAIILPIAFQVVQNVLQPIVLFNRIDFFPCVVGCVSAILILLQIRSVILRS